MGRKLTEEEAEKRALEMEKLLYDFFKHLTTLSTGSILLLATFLEKLFQHPGGKWLVFVALGAFVACVLGSLVAMFTTVMSGESPGKVEESSPAAIWLSFATALLSGVFFFVGLLALGIFACINL